MKPTLSRTSLLRVTAVTVALLASPFAHAHAYPVHQVPGAGASVSPAPTTVAIDFDEDLEASFSSINVTDAQGKPVTTGKAAVDSAHKKHMSVALAPLPPGTYAVAWVALASDGHRTQGHYPFTVK